MTENQFDEIFRNKLKDYSSQVPDNFWQRIQPEDKDRKGFIFWLWYLIVPVCLLSGFASAFYHKSTHPVARHSAHYTPASQAHTTLSTTSSASANRFLISATTSSMSIANPTTASISVTNPLATSVPATHPDKPGRSSTSVANTKAPLAHPTRLKVFPIAPSNPAPPAHSVNTTHSNHTTHTDHSANTYHQNKAAISIPASQANSDNSFDSPSQPGTPHGLPLPDITPIPNTRYPLKIDITQRTITSPANLPAKKITPTNLTPRKNPLSSLKKGSWQLDLYASPDMPILQYKNGDQQSQLSFTAGLKINRSFGNNFSGATGLQYSQVNTKVNYDSGAISRTAHLKITSFEFPLLIGYGIGNDRFRATLNTGMIFKIHSTGELHTTSASLYLGLDLSKRVSDKISIFADPYYMYNLSGSSSSQYFVQRINRTGLSVGIRYNFTKTKQRRKYNVDQ